MTDGADFGSVIVGSTVAHTFTVQNQGSGNLYLDTIIFTGDFSLGTAPTSRLHRAVLRRSLKFHAVRDRHA